MSSPAWLIAVNALILAAPASTKFARISVSMSILDASLSQVLKFAWSIGMIVQETATLPVEFKISFIIDIKFDFSFYQAFIQRGFGGLGASSSL